MSVPAVFEDAQTGFDPVEATMRAWAVEQLAPWMSLSLSLSYEQTQARFEALQLSEPDVFLFSIRNGGVQLLQKPLSARHVTYEASLYRAVLYRSFLQRVVERYCPKIETSLALFVGDGALHASDVPVFAFQKPRGNSSPLLPDVDLINPAFFADEKLQDSIPYIEKRISAVFAGATTGGAITPQAIEQRSIPRIRAGLFFKDNPDVLFYLPRIVQCFSPKSEEILRGMGFGDGIELSWKEQFKHRFTLSMDGNGPSCARISIGLKSNSVLVQYASHHLMYYFSGLTPWLHYLPVKSDQEVVNLVKIEHKSPGFFEYVANAGRNFSDTFLGQEQVMQYTAQLLQNYHEILTKEFAVAPVSISSEEIEVLLHVGGIGDVRAHGDIWAGGGDPQHRIEGVAVSPSSDFLAQHLVYRAMASDGSFTPWVPAGEFCGSRGQARSLSGFQMRLNDEAADQFECVIGACFSDGTQIEPTVMTEMMALPSRAEMTALYIKVQETV